MNPSMGDGLYRLLPAVYRLRDAEKAQAGVLQDLLKVLGDQGDVVEADIDQLYDNWFIETCDEWVASYIGDLLGVRPLHPVGPGTASPRALVANTIAYRRRKGTAAVLEQLTSDVTGWRARAVELFQLLATTQQLNHVRPGNLRTPDLRRAASLELLDGPFDQAAHTATARPVGRGGRYAIEHVGLFVWRLAPYRVTGGTPRPAADPPDGRYRLDPTGLDVPLVNLPRTETEITHIAEERDVPALLRRRALYDELEARRQALADGRPIPPPTWFGDDPALTVTTDQGTVPPEELLVCDLRDQVPAPPTGWRRPPPTRTYRRADGSQVALPITVAVDPVLGRLAFPDGVVPAELRAEYAYAFSADVGAGPYSRRGRLPADLLGGATWFRAVSPRFPAQTDLLVPTLAEAVRAWNAAPPGTVGVIAVLDSSTYAEELTGDATVRVPAGSELLVVAAQWPQVQAGGPHPPGSLNATQLVPDELRPHLLGPVEVLGTPGDADAPPGRLTLSGLLVEGRLRVAPGDLGRLTLASTTLVPAGGGLLVSSTAAEAERNDSLTVELARSVSGPVALAATVPGLRLADSAVDGAGQANAVDAPGADVSLEACTVLGATGARRLEASDTIFSGPVTVERRQDGCVRFSFVPAGSSTPRHHRCQPDLALDPAHGPVDEAAVRARLEPVFGSERYGDPDYLQLGPGCAAELTEGASDTAEMGVFHHLQQPRRTRNLRAALDEYLRFGLEAGVFDVT
jgi:hypothetical protein